MSLTADLGEWYDSSKLTTYQLCPRRYYWRYARHLVKTGDNSAALTFGSAFHLALEAIYKSQPLPAAEQIFLDNFPLEIESGDRTRSNGVRLLAGYAAKWRDETFELLTPPEQAFSLQLNNAHYVGRIDLLTIDSAGVVRPLDHKTTTRFGQLFELSFKVDIQQTGYIMAARALTGKPVCEAIINGVRVTSKVTPESFLRKYTSRFPWELEEWTESIRSLISRIRASQKDDDWPKAAPSGCFAYNRVCPYYGLCTTRNPEQLVETSFHEEIWEPV